MISIDWHIADRLRAAEHFDRQAAYWRSEWGGDRGRPKEVRENSAIECEKRAKQCLDCAELLTRLRDLEILKGPGGGTY